jgi:hypothetical protein
MLQNEQLPPKFFKKIGTQTKKNMLSSKVTKAEAYGEKKQQKLNVKNDIVLKR